MKVEPNCFLLTALLASLLLNGFLFYKLQQAREAPQRESWVAPLQRPMKAFDTTAKTNHP